MIVHAILNNYQMGSYAHNCMSNRIISEERLNRSYTKVVWNLETESEKRLLIRALGNRAYRLKEDK